MLIGYTDEMTDRQLGELADWADAHAKKVPNPRWKRAYALIREGADLLLRRRALNEYDGFEPPVVDESEHKNVISPCVNCGRETPCPDFPSCGKPKAPKGKSIR